MSAAQPLDSFFVFNSQPKSSKENTQKGQTCRFFSKSKPQIPSEKDK